MHMYQSLFGKAALVALCLMTSLAALAAREPATPQPVTNEQLMPKMGSNSCFIDPRLRVNLEGLLGCVVNLTSETPPAAVPAKVVGTHVEQLVSFRKGSAPVANNATENIYYHSLLEKQQTTTTSILNIISASLGKQDILEVKSIERPSVGISVSDIDLNLLVKTFKSLSPERQAQLGVITGLTPFVVSTSVYTERPTSVSGNYFGVKIGKGWLYKTTEDTNEYYLIAVYAPISLLLSLNEEKVNMASIDVNTLLNDTSKSTTDPALQQALQLVPRNDKNDITPKSLWQGAPMDDEHTVTIDSTK